MTLLHGLRELGFRNLVLVHVNHRLRGRASDADSRLVVREAKKAGLPIRVDRAETKAYAVDRGVSIELAARELRHCAFARAARDFRCNRIVLAHHAEDQVETCLFRFLRGSGASGLAGMRRVTEMRMGRRKLQFLRPMLDVRRSQIDAAAAAWGVAFRDDATNAESDATRNRIRNQVLPKIYDTFGTSAADAILRAAEIFRAEDDWMESMLPEFAKGRELDVKGLLGCAPALQRRMVRRWLIANGVGEPGFGQVERVIALLDFDEGPAKINLPGGMHARRQAGRIFLEAE